MNVRFDTLNEMSAYVELDLLLISFIYLVFSSLEMQRKLIENKVSILQLFLICLKRNESQIFKSSSCKKFFPQCVSYRYVILFR